MMSAVARHKVARRPPEEGEGEGNREQNKAGKQEKA